jgi:hypothetical protein
MPYTAMKKNAKQYTSLFEEFVRFCNFMSLKLLNDYRDAIYRHTSHITVHEIIYFYNISCTSCVSCIISPCETNFLESRSSIAVSNGSYSTVLWHAFDSHSIYCPPVTTGIE